MLGARPDSLVILGWHNVEPTWCFPGCTNRAAARRLRRQLVTLRRTANVVPLSDAVKTILAGDRLPPRAVALTFDDGYRDNLTIAAPLLAQLDLPATFFLACGLLDGSVRAWWEVAASAVRTTDVRSLEWDGMVFDLSTPSARIAAARSVCERLKRRDSHERWDAVDDLLSRAPARSAADEGRFMSWDDARKAVEMGIEIGSHTRTHPILSEESLESQDQELTESRVELSTRLGVSIHTLAYPNGTVRDYTEATARIAQRAGYLAAVTTVGRANDASAAPFELGRFCVDASGGIGDLLRVTRSLRREAGHIAAASRPVGEDQSSPSAAEVGATEHLDRG